MVEAAHGEAEVVTAVAPLMSVVRARELVLTTLRFVVNPELVRARGAGDGLAFVCVCVLVSMLVCWCVFVGLCVYVNVL